MQQRARSCTLDPYTVTFSIKTQSPLLSASFPAITATTDCPHMQPPISLLLAVPFFAALIAHIYTHGHHSSVLHVSRSDVQCIDAAAAAASPIALSSDASHDIDDGR